MPTITNKNAFQQDAYHPLQWPSWGCVADTPLGQTPPYRHPLGRHPTPFPWADTSLGRYPWADTPWADTPLGQTSPGTTPSTPTQLHVGIHPPGYKEWHTPVKTLPSGNYCGKKTIYFICNCLKMVVFSIWPISRNVSIRCWKRQLQ